ncbi:LapA family protein [Desulfonatronum thiodismutans]|uniref:LapA family protein n=1 Tax=Desulfonatronum thiodismutans TaxID=159290 RepID=UPI001376FA8F|nr:LapA family protein [Desulfonatronum thiodismutans]
MVIHWPGLLSVEFGLPTFVLISILFAIGVVLTSLTYLGEHFRLKRSVAETKQNIADLERELLPEPEPEPDTESQAVSQAEFKTESDSTFETSEPEEQREDSSAAWLRGAVAAEISSTETSTLTFQNPTESTMEKTTASESENKVLAENTGQAATNNTTDPSPENQEKTPESPSHPQASDTSDSSQTVLESISESLDKQSAKSSRSDNASENRSEFKEDEVLERPSGPGWGAVLFLSAALALVVSSGVYIVLNNQVSKMAEQLGDLHIQSGHMASTQEEMGRVWERERVSVRDEIESLGQGQKQLGAGIESLEEQMLALQALPEIMRKQLVAGFLRDTAGKTAFLGSQVETEEQRETLERVEEMLQSLAKELENAEKGR